MDGTDSTVSTRCACHISKTRYYARRIRTQRWKKQRNENFSARYPWIFIIPRRMTSLVRSLIFLFFLFFLSVFLPRLRTRSTFLIAHHGHCRISTCFTTLFTLLSPPPRLCPIFRETTERNRRFGHCFVFEINTYIYIYITLPSNFLLF